MNTIQSRLRVSKASALVALAALTLLVAACGRDKADERPPEPGDTAVAKVDGHTVWASDVKREAVAQGLISEGEPLDIGSDLFRQRLDEVIDQKLLAAEALKQKLDKDPVAQRRLAAARERILGDMLPSSRSCPSAARRSAPARSWSAARPTPRRSRSC
jgi:peptidyl-prolyl cis-trans isomerase C